MVSPLGLSSRRRELRCGANVLVSLLILLSCLCVASVAYETCSLSPDSVCSDMTCGAVDLGAIEYANVNEDECQCGIQNIGHAFGPCVDNQRAVVYYWKPPALCLNQTLPPPSFVPCEGCSAGHFIDPASGSCQPCPAGSAWDGIGARVVDTWDALPMGFHTYCAALPGKTCASWTLMGDVISSGENYNYHYLESFLTIRVNIVKPGSVSFSYRVSSENGKDGLMFGDSNLYVLGISNSDWTEYTYHLTVGWHQLDWVYSKDYWGSSGEDKAYISKIKIIGTEQDPIACPLCPPGTYSSVSGSQTCTPCSGGQISAKPYGSTGCSVCGSGSYSYPGSDYCVPIPPCTLEDDYVTFTTPCVDGTRTRKTRLILPAACDDKSPIVIPEDQSESCTLHCSPGEAPSQGACAYCSGNSASSDGLTCAQCPTGSSVVAKTITYDYWDVLPNNFVTGCTGTNCRTSGWRTAYNYVDSGVGHGPNVQSWIRTTVELVQPGTVSYNLTLECEESNLDGVYLTVNDVLYTTHKCGGCNAPSSVYSLDLLAGAYNITWSYNKFTEPRLRCDRALLSPISFTGTALGGASACATCPKNTYASPGGCTMCSAGTFSKAGASSCSKCPAGSVSDEGGDCYACGGGTTSKAGDKYCSFNCSDLAIKINMGKGVMRHWDLSQISSNKMLGPVPFPQATDKELYFSFCKPNNNECDGDNVDKAVLTNVCLKEMYTIPDAVNTTTTTTVTGLGRVASFASIDYPFIGLQANFTHGDRGCKSIISMICNPTVNDTQPELISFIDDDTTCIYQFKWLTSAGCPLCDATDWSLTTSQCDKGKQTGTYYLRTPNSCRDGFAPPSWTIKCHDVTLKHDTLWVILATTIGGVFFLIVASFVAFLLYRKNKDLEVRYSQLKDQMANNQVVDSDMLSVQERGTSIGTGSANDDEMEMQTISVN